jgi:branched-chain amino acid transport system substrate-binding protein
MKKKFALPFLLMIAIALCACSTAKTDAVPGEILIGEYVSLTGNTATFGISTRNGIEMATREVNKSGGILGKTVRVIVEDDHGLSEEALTVVNKLIAKDHVVALLGEIASSLSRAAGPVAQSNKIPMITPASTHIEVTRIGDYIFRICFIDSFQDRILAEFAKNSLRVNKVAILYADDNDYSEGLAEGFRQEFTGLGGTIVAQQSYRDGDKDFSTQLTAIKAVDAQVIFIPGYYTEVGLIARQTRNLGIKATLLGGDGWDSPHTVEIGGEALEDSYFSDHYSIHDEREMIQTFVDNYKARYGLIPDALAALGYDAAHILFKAIAKAQSTEPSAIRNAIAETANYPGITGTITIGPDRNAIKPAVILQIKNGTFSRVMTIQP